MSRQSNTDSHKGKTKRDRASGALSRNAANKEARAMWQQDNKSTTNTFPFATCNGFNGRRWKRWMKMM